MRSTAQFLMLAAVLVAVVSLKPVTPAQAQTFDLSDIYVRTAFFSVDTGALVTGSVICDRNLGDRVLNGGYRVDSSDQTFTHAYRSHALFGSVWTVSIINGSIFVAANVTVWAICAPSGAFGAAGIQLVSTDSTVNANSTRGVVATCPAGFKTLGGGYMLFSGSELFRVYRSYPPTSTQWRIDVLNATPVARNAQVFATCYPATAPISVKVASFGFGTFSARVREGAATCDPGLKTLGGGYFLSSSNFNVLRSYPSAPNTWAVRVIKLVPFTSTSVTVYALCYPASSLFVGLAGLAPAGEHSVPGDAPIGYTLHYEVPEPMIWEDLEWVELQLHDDDGPLVRLRLDEAANTLSVWDRLTGVFTPGLPVGSGGLLESALATLDLDRSTWWEEAPVGRGRGLRLVFWLAPELAEGRYRVTVVAHNDDGVEEEAEPVTSTLLLGPEGSSPFAAALAQLDHVVEAVADHGPGHSLHAKAQMLRKAVENSDMPRACRRLGTFLQKVEIQSDRHLSLDEATHFLADVNTLPDLLGCEEDAEEEDDNE